MARKASPKGKRSSDRGVRRRLRFVPALVIGIGLLAAGVFFWQRSAEAAFSEELFQRLPKDSYLAGAADLRRFERATLTQASQSAGLAPRLVGDALGAFDRAGVAPVKLVETFEPRIAFARTERGDVAVLKVKSDAAFDELTKALGSQATGAQSVERTTPTGKISIWQATLQGTSRTVAAYRSGQDLYLGSTPELAAAASSETDGFDRLEQFRSVSDRLAPGAHAYVFLNAAQRRQPPVSFPLVGMAVTNQTDQYRLAVEVADAPPVTAVLETSSGRLMPTTDLAAGTIQGRNVSRFLQLLQDQRQETDLPRVIAFQNGLAALNRKLGADVDTEFLQAAGGDFTYSRYRTAEGTNQWFGSLQFTSPEVAQERVARLVQLLRERVPVPTRREIVRILPDGSQSREIVSEGNEPIEISDFSVEGRAGQAAALPGVGTLHWLVEGQYLVLGSSPEAVGRMVRTITSPPPGVELRGQLSVRLKLTEAGSLTLSRDALFDWLMAVQPSSGTFVLDKASGELRGGVRFQETR